MQQQSTKVQPDYLLTEEVLALLRISRSTLDRLRKLRKVPAPAVVGGMLRWKRTALQEWLDRGGMAAEEASHADPR